MEQLATAGKLSRLLHHPGKYIYAMLLSRLVYPVTHKSSLKDAPLFFGGHMQVLLPASTDIYLAGGKTHDSEIRFAKYLVRNLKEGHTFLDIGAHFGYFTLMASALVGDKGTVTAIEPARGSFDLLKTNVAGKENISVHHRAVSDVSGEVSFFEFPVLYSEYNTLNAEQFKDSAWIRNHPPVKNTVQSVTIDGFLQANNLLPDMIKMDIEGAEIQAINGGMSTWNNTSPVVIMEYLLDSENDTHDKAATKLGDCGYKMHMIDAQGGLVPVDNIVQYMRSNNMTSENIVFIKRDNN